MVDQLVMIVLPPVGVGTGGSVPIMEYLPWAGGGVVGTAEACVDTEAVAVEVEVPPWSPVLVRVLVRSSAFGKAKWVAKGLCSFSAAAGVGSPPAPKVLIMSPKARRA